MKRFAFIVIFCYSGLNIVSAQFIKYDSVMAEITAHIKTKYVEPINIDSIINIMVNQYLSEPETLQKIFAQLDPHSNYMNAEEYADLKTGLTGNFFGVGAVLSFIRDTAYIVRVFDGGPAQRSGLLPGDRIIAINDTSITGEKANYDYVVKRLKGAKGTTVNIQLLRDNDQIQKFTCTRDQIDLKSVEAYFMQDKTTGYIKLTYFGETTTAEMQKALASLNKMGMQKLILDLRDNYGGLMRGALGVADEFISENKLLVYTEGYYFKREDYNASISGLFEQGEMVVLINEYTASSGEILTGALQDNKRATIIGKRSYGKGLVQNLYVLSDSVTALKLTTQRYYTPSGKCIQRPFEDGTEAYFNDQKIAMKIDGETPAIYKNNEWGIHPDIYYAEDTLFSNRLFTELFYRSYFDQPANYYYAHHRDEFKAYKNVDDFINKYQVTSTLFNMYSDFLIQQENNLDESEKLKYNQSDINAIKSKIENALKANIARGIWGDDAFFKILNVEDQEITIAKKHLK